MHAGDLPYQPLPAYSAAGFAWQVTEKSYPREVSHPFPSRPCPASSSAVSCAVCCANNVSLRMQSTWRCMYAMRTFCLGRYWHEACEHNTVKYTSWHASELDDSFCGRFNRWKYRRHTVNRPPSGTSWTPLTPRLSLAQMPARTTGAWEGPCPTCPCRCNLESAWYRSAFVAAGLCITCQIKSLCFDILCYCRPN